MSSERRTVELVELVELVKLVELAELYFYKYKIGLDFL